MNSTENTMIQSQDNTTQSQDKVSSHKPKKKLLRKSKKHTETVVAPVSQSQPSRNPKKKLLRKSKKHTETVVAPAPAPEPESPTETLSSADELLQEMKAYSQEALAETEEDAENVPEALPQESSVNVPDEGDEVMNLIQGALHDIETGKVYEPIYLPCEVDTRFCIARTWVGGKASQCRKPVKITDEDGVGWCPACYKKEQMNVPYWETVPAEDGKSDGRKKTGLFCGRCDDPMLLPYKAKGGKIKYEATCKNTYGEWDCIFNNEPLLASAMYDESQEQGYIRLGSWESARCWGEREYFPMCGFNVCMKNHNLNMQVTRVFDEDYGIDFNIKAN